MCKKWRLEDIPMECVYKTQMGTAIRECLWAVEHNATHCPPSLMHEAFEKYHTCSGKCLKRPSDCGEHGMVNQTTCKCQVKPCHDCGDDREVEQAAVDTRGCDCTGATPCKFKLPGYSYCGPFVVGTQECAALTENCMAATTARAISSADGPGVEGIPAVAVGGAETVDQSFSDNFDV
jgi:hypothetical protein